MVRWVSVLAICLSGCSILVDDEGDGSVEVDPVPTLPDGCGTTGALTDSFTSSSLFEDLWDAGASGPGALVPQRNNSEVTLDLDGDAREGFRVTELVSRHAYSIRGDSVLLRIITRHDPYHTALELRQTPSFFNREVIGIQVIDGMIQAYARVDQSFEVFGEAPAGPDMYVRIREIDDEIVIDTAPRRDFLADQPTSVGVRRTFELDPEMVWPAFAVWGVDPIVSPVSTRVAGFNTGNAEVPSCSIEILGDAFEDGDLDRRWNPVPANCTVEEVGGTVRFDNADGAFCEVQSSRAYDFQDTGEVWARIGQFPSADSARLTFGVQGSGNRELRMFQQGETLHLEIRDDGGREVEASLDNPRSEGQYWRIVSVAPGAFDFEVYDADGMFLHGDQLQTATEPDLTHARVRLINETLGDAATASFESVNLQPE